MDKKTKSKCVDPEIFKRNKTTLSKLKKGDLVKFLRFGYYHWGVYIGDENIVHRAPIGNVGGNGKSSRCPKAKVVIENFWNVAGSSEAYKDNINDGLMKPLDPKKIVENAKSKIGQVGYDLIFANCEHFATLCRYGVAGSAQADLAMFSISGIFPPLAIAYAIVRIID